MNFWVQVINWSVKFLFNYVNNYNFKIIETINFKNITLAIFKIYTYIRYMNSLLSLKFYNLIDLINIYKLLKKR